MSSALHHEAGTALGHVRENGFAAMQANGVPQVHGEHEIHHGSCRQAERFDLEEDSHRRQVPRSTTMQTPTWH
jgi:hypothetical protein